MKALEMEDEEELERFLDEEDGTLPARTTNGSSVRRRGGGSGGRTFNSSFSASSVAKIVVALVFVVVVLSLTYAARREATDDLAVSEEDRNKKDPPTPGSGPRPSPTTLTSPTTPPATVPLPGSGSGSGSGPAPPAPSPFKATNTVKRTPKPTEERVPNDFGYSKVSQFPPDLESIHQEESDEAKNARVEKWGRWKFFDGEEDNRPGKDYCSHFPYRDVHGDDFPDSSWQVDAVFVNHLIDAAEQLVSRAKEAVYTEFGYGKPLPTEMLATRTKGFKWTLVDLASEETIEPPEAYRPGGNRGNGGWTSRRSQQGLARRLLHAIMTNDVFTIVVAGGSSAAGHGGHFHQSYAIQMHRVLRPVLARMGVRLVTRNLSVGSGMGTILSVLGFRDLYGDDIDLVIWDAGSAEDSDDGAKEILDLFLRQALLSGRNKVPIVWVGTNAAFDVLKDLHNAVDADLGEFGTGMDEVKATESHDQVQSLPYLVQYLKCADSASSLCAERERFCAHCWIPRDDVDPEASFDVDMAESPQSQKSDGNMGWREHLLASRVLIMSVLDGLQSAIQIFSEGTMGGPPLEDDAWHVADYYENIRNKLKALDPEFGACAKLKEKNLPLRICHNVMKGRGLHTPRSNPVESSLLAIVRAAPDGYKPVNNAKMAYEGPDAHNSCYDIPENGVDILSIVSGRRRLGHDEISISSSTESHIKINTPQSSPSIGQLSNIRELDEIVPGKGWEVIREKPGTCDGQYESICGRERSDSCPLLGYHDSPGILVGNEYSGWLVFDIPDVNDGLILVAMNTGLKSSDNPRTEGWSSVNNERRALDNSFGATESSPGSEPETRDLGDDLPDNLVLDWAINGAITSWDKATLLEKRAQPQDKVELWTILDDASFDQKGKVELAIRLRGCGNRCTLGVSHVYWA